MVSHSKNLQVTQYRQRASLSRAGQFPFRKYTAGSSSHRLLLGLYSTFTSDLTNWKKKIYSSYRGDLKKILDLIISIFTTHHLNLENIQTPLNIQLTADKDGQFQIKLMKRIIQECPTQPWQFLDKDNWDLDSGDLAFLEHYNMCYWKELRKRCLNKRP